MIETKKGWEEYWGSEKTLEKVMDINTAYPRVVDELLGLTKKRAKCLELGCGSGNYSLELISNGRKCIASDYSKNALKATEMKGQRLFGINPTIQRIDAYNIPYKDDSFDLVFSDGLIEHLDLQKTLKEQYRVIKPGGWVVAKVPNGLLLYSIIFCLTNLTRWFPHEDYHFKDEWEVIFKNIGFKEVEVKECGSILMAVSRRIFKSKRVDKFVPNVGKIYYLIKGKK